MTSIEWTDETWNPIRARRAPLVAGGQERVGWACVRVSPGCVNCYAATMNRRLGTGLDYTVPALQGVEPFLDERALAKPFTWRKPRRVFVCSMTDLFGEWVRIEWLVRIFDVMASVRLRKFGDPGVSRLDDDEGEPDPAAPIHTYQLLTKRPDVARQMIESIPSYAEQFLPGDSGLAVALEVGAWPLPNVWVGASVERQKEADERIPELLNVPARTRFLSCEPLLGPVTLRPGFWLPCEDCGGRGWYFDPRGPGGLMHAQPCELCVRRATEVGHVVHRGDYARSVSRVDWVIVGGESGARSRPFEYAWARSLIAECATARVPAFMKQVGARPVRAPSDDLDAASRVLDAKGGDPLEWPADLRVREWPRPAEERSL